MPMPMPPPAELAARLAAQPEETVNLLVCTLECFQYSAVPILWRDRFSGTLVLSRSLADSLQEFNARTGAEVAILRDRGASGPPPGTAPIPQVAGMAMPAITNAQQTVAVVEAAARNGVLAAANAAPAIMQLKGDWYEFFQLEPALAAGVQTLVINQVTAQQLAIRHATRNSVLIGILGLVLSETLLLVVLHTPVSRIRRLVALLPLLAENRFQDLRDRLPMRRLRRAPSDEIDVMVNTVGRLTNRMEDLQRRRAEAEERLVWLADHDPLTQLFNRRRFTDDFDRMLDRALRYRRTGALLFFDLDQFKDVNDLSGHEAGDTLLRLVADRLRSLLRSSDLLGRLGGDEFALVLPESSAQHALTVANRVQELIQDIVLTVRRHRHRVFASIGIVLFPEHGRDAHDLLANADLAMYQAKDRGRGRCHLFSIKDQAREKVDARVIWMDQIDQALKHDRFELHFQPIVELATGIIRHAEALIRMRDAEGGLVYPGSFIPVAEKTGRMQVIDHWVLGRSIATLARNPGLCLSANLSANAMEDDTLLPDLEKLLAEHDVAAERLTFELTETVAVNSLLNATRLMQRIQDLGCRFALDGGWCG
jgi:diguanylate cyclase (GGDEF)-like protein